MEGTTQMAIGDAGTAARTLPSAQGTHLRERSILVTGAWTGVVGALLAFVANALHPHPNDFSLEALLQSIAENSAWSAVHMTLLMGLLLILGSFVAITLSLEGEPGALAARYALAASLLGGTLIFVSTAADGFAMNLLARGWLDAPAGEKASALRMADTIEVSQYAVYSLSVVVFLGVGVFLYGLAVVQSRAYPGWLGWLALVSGAGALVVGVAQCFGGPDFRATEIFFVLFSMLSTIWVLVMGVLMWRKAQAVKAQPAAAPRSL
jgi:hypothetical protein